MDKKVILLADVKGVGHKNDMVNVSVGFAANYLLPKHLATDATPERMAVLNKRKLIMSQEKEVALAHAKELAANLTGKSVTIQAKATPQGRLYGGVTSDDIASAINAQLGLSIDKKAVTTEEPIRALGIYTVVLKLNPQVSATLSISVTEIV